jgi:hypothetical protein
VGVVVPVFSKDRGTFVFKGKQSKKNYLSSDSWRYSSDFDTFTRLIELLRMLFCV